MYHSYFLTSNPFQFMLWHICENLYLSIGTYKQYTKCIIGEIIFMSIESRFFVRIYALHSNPWHLVMVNEHQDRRKQGGGWGVRWELPHPPSGPPEFDPYIIEWKALIITCPSRFLDLLTALEYDFFHVYPSYMFSVYLLCIIVEYICTAIFFPMAPMT